MVAAISAFFAFQPRPAFHARPPAFHATAHNIRHAHHPRLATSEPPHAVVLGSSFAGMFAASTLSDAGWRVTIIEKDDTASTDVRGTDVDAVAQRLRGRKGVPQARHLHTLLAGGAQAAEELMPGFMDDLEAAGAERIDF